jgi:hypothetical protein
MTEIQKLQLEENPQVQDCLYTSVLTFQSILQATLALSATLIPITVFFILRSFVWFFS